MAASWKEGFVSLQARSALMSPYHNTAHARIVGPGRDGVHADAKGVELGGEDVARVLLPRLRGLVGCTRV